MILAPVGVLKNTRSVVCRPLFGNRMEPSLFSCVINNMWQIAIMIKTQVQIPDGLYRKAKQIAKEREWSLAEVMRRGLEYMTNACPPVAGGFTGLPILSGGQFSENIDDLDLKAISEADESMRGGHHD